MAAGLRGINPVLEAAFDQAAMAAGSLRPDQEPLGDAVAGVVGSVRDPFGERDR